MNTPTLAFIGAGNMAQAVIKGLIANGYNPNNIIATGRDQTKLDNLASATNINITTDNLAACQQADAVILAVKPAQIQAVVEQLKPVFDSHKQVFISLAAGIPSQSIVSWSQQTCAVVRAMPNTPSTVGLGAAGLFANAHATQAHKELAQHIMDAVGLSIWVTNEQQIDAVVAVSGSGPAYYFLMMEAMVETAQKLGFSPSEAKTLVLQTALGAATLATQSEYTPAQLRQAVTSPKGTTEQAIKSLIDNQYPQIISQAMEAARARSVELAKQLG